MAAPAQFGLSPELKEALDKFISSNKVVLFMKGTRQFPQVRWAVPAPGMAVLAAYAWVLRHART